MVKEDGGDCRRYACDIGVCSQVEFESTKSEPYTYLPHKQNLSSARIEQTWRNSALYSLGMKSTDIVHRC